MPTEVETAYAAGFFDGEGCVAALVANRGNLVYRVTIGQSTAEVLHWLQELYGGKRGAA